MGQLFLAIVLGIMIFCIIYNAFPSLRNNSHKDIKYTEENKCDTDLDAYVDEFGLIEYKDK